ncbi:MAG: type II toxin-antitoxin system Phd/YefM family antitoxin [Burkholderiales bacterium]|nr:type II toxin-antitoxin system Phd/YefM family antitoxin [Burkholderiales bacterium]
MDISVTEFKANCLELIRKVEEGGEVITIRRRGKIVARLEPPKSHEKEVKPWEKLRGSGVLLAEPGESVISDEDFEAMR